MKPDDDSVFCKPSVPINPLQLLSWLVFEPTLLERYSKTLTRKQVISSYLQAMPWIVIISVSVYLLKYFVIVASDIFLLFLSKFEIGFVGGYYLADGFIEKLLISFCAGFLPLIVLIIIFCMAGGLAGGVFFGLAKGLAGGMAIGLVAGLGIGLINVLSKGLVFGLANGLAFGLTFGLSFMVAFGRNFGQAGSWTGGLIFGLVSGGSFMSAYGWAAGLANGLAWYFAFFRIYNYPLYWLRSLWRFNFYDSPYHRDELIWFPLWGVAEKFRRLAVQSPADAAKFIAFLREYRPLQRRLADQIAHAAMAGTWLNQPLAFECFSAPTIENKDFQPTEDWLNQLSQLKQQLIAYRQQIQPS
jgi:hypothetical protein